MASAALGGYILCGINDNRRGAELTSDILHADCQILLTDPRMPGCWRVQLPGAPLSRHINHVHDTPRRRRKDLCLAATDHGWSRMARRGPPGMSGRISVFGKMVVDLA